MTVSQSLSVILNNRLSLVTPALFMTMWSPPRVLYDRVDGSSDVRGVRDVDS